MGRPKSNRVCDVPGCGKKHYGNGLCLTHNRRQRRGQPLEGVLRLQHLPPEERFWAQVQKGPDCWEWIGARNHNGYGVLRWQGRYQPAHRVSLMIAGFEVRPGDLACHHCDNPPCVRPDHLYVGDAYSNQRDSVARGRHRGPDKRGERNNWAKLTAEQVAEMRRLRSEGAYLKDLAARYRVSIGNVSMICAGKTWR